VRLDLAQWEAAATFSDDYADNQDYSKGIEAMKAGLATTINDEVRIEGKSGRGNARMQSQRTLTSTADGSAAADIGLPRGMRRRWRPGR
jgi:hypothetical protein